MYRFMQRHGKKLMAVFAAFLMIAFAYTGKNSYSSTRNNPVVARMGGEKVRQQDVYHVSQVWDLLAHTPYRDRAIVDILGPYAVAQIKAKPVLFLLLQKEADRMGVTVSLDQLNALIANAPELKTGNPDRDDDIKMAVAQLWKVRQAFARASSAIKISEPVVEHELAAMAQSITLSVADFTTSQYSAKVPPTSAEQLKSQFEHYGDVIKGSASAENPFGFGYKYPDRLKLQYIAISRAEVRKYVESFAAPSKPKDPYEWEVEAQKYYRQHQNEFPTTQPDAPKQDTRFSFDTPAARPTTRPFAEVRDQIRNRLIDAATDAKVAQIIERITTTLASDWVTYHGAVGASTQPVKAPPSSLGAAYDSVEYLQKLAAEIQRAYGVLPTIQSIADKWQTGEDLFKLAGFGQSALLGSSRPIGAPLYIMGYTAPFLPEENRSETGVLQLFEPSRPLEDMAKTIYLARVSAADPAHKPATLAEVEPQVRQDVIMKQAYDLAKADATRLLETARDSGLKSAAAGKNLITVGPLTQQRSQPIIGLPITGDAANVFLQEAFKLVSTASSKPAAKPVRLIEIPGDGRIEVAELSDVQALWTERSRAFEEAQLAMMLKGELGQRFGRDWFDYNAVVTRLQYVPEKSLKDKDEEPAPIPEQPAAPIF